MSLRTLSEMRRHSAQQDRLLDAAVDGFRHTQLPSFNTADFERVSADDNGNVTVDMALSDRDSAQVIFDSKKQTGTVHASRWMSVTAAEDSGPLSKGRYRTLVRRLNDAIDNGHLAVTKDVRQAIARAAAGLSD